MKILGGLVRLIVGVAFGVLAALALMPLSASFYTGGDPGAGGVPLIAGAILVCAALCFFAPTLRRAFGRGFLLAGVSFAALPISMMFLTGKIAKDMVGNADAGDQVTTAIGAGLGGAAVTGLATFVGLIVGGILIIIGLVLALGGRREVIVVHHGGLDR